MPPRRRGSRGDLVKFVGNSAYGPYLNDVYTGRGKEGPNTDIRSYLECFCDVARKSKFTLKRDVAKSLRIGPNDSVPDTAKKWS